MIHRQKPQAEKVKIYYDNGKLKEIGTFYQKQKHSIWNYYSPQGLYQRKEKWKKGTMIWAIYYTPKHRKAKTIDSKGKIKIYKDCGC